MQDTCLLYTSLLKQERQLKIDQEKIQKRIVKEEKDLLDKEGQLARIDLSLIHIKMCIRDRSKNLDFLKKKSLKFFLQSKNYLL